MVTSSGYEEHVLCPFHDDKNASASWNYRKGMFYCHTCKTGFNLRQMGEKLKMDLRDMTIDRVMTSDQFKLELFAPEHPIPGPRALTPKMLDYLKGRQISLKAIRAYFYGTADGLGVMIRPVNRQLKLCCSITRVMEPPPGHPRYYVNGIKPALWPLEELQAEYETLIIVEGIFSRVRIGDVLNNLPIAHRVGVLSLLGSSIKEDELRPILDQVKWKRLVFLFDDDFAGHSGASFARVLFPLAEAFVVSKKLDEISTKNLDRFVRKFI